MKRITLSDGNRVNSKGYKIDLKGINFDRFKLNPVMLYNHKDDKVIGRWENWMITDNKLEADPIFDTGHELGAEVERQFENDFLRASSIGLIVYDAAYINDELIVTKSELIEASIVTIPADAGAVVLYNENKEVLSLEQLQLNFDNNNNNQSIQNQSTMQITLSQHTIQMLGLNADATTKDLELAIAKKDNEIETLKASLKTETQKQQSDYLNNAVKVGKITEAEKLNFAILSENGGFDTVKSIIDAKTESASMSLADQVQKSELSAGRETWDYLKWSQEDPKGLLKLKHDNPAQFERIQKTLKK